MSSNRCAKIAIFVLKYRAMDIMDFREYVLSLPEVEECTPFDDVTLVYKVGGRMFVCADMEEFDHIVVHHDPEVGETLRDQWREVVPAWHFNKRYWSSMSIGGDMPDRVVRELIFRSYIYTIHHNVTPKARREELLGKVEHTKP